MENNKQQVKMMQSEVKLLNADELNKKEVLQALAKEGRSYPHFKGYSDIPFLIRHHYDSTKYQQKAFSDNSITHALFVNGRPLASLTTCSNQWLSTHFGFAIGNLYYMTTGMLENKYLIMLFKEHLELSKKHFFLIMTTFPEDETELNETAQQEGFFLTTTREKYLASKDSYQPVALRHLVIPYADQHADEAESLLSGVTFPSHFSNDSRLDQEKVRMMYAEWMLKETEATMKSVVYRSGALVGIASMQLDLHQDSEQLPRVYKQGLIAVKPNNSGVAYSLVAYGLNEGLKTESHVEFVVSREVIGHTRMLKKLGMTPIGAENVLHFWAS